MTENSAIAVDFTEEGDVLRLQETTAEEPDVQAHAVGSSFVSLATAAGCGYGP